MFCENCKVEIPPAWKKVIQSNECPACGKEIMTDKTKELLDEIKQAMERMPNDPEGLSGWLVSNYKMVKIGDASPTTFYGPNNRQAKTQANISQGNTVDDYLRRAGMDKHIGKPSKMQALVNRMNSNVNRQDEEEIYEGEIYDEEHNEDDVLMYNESKSLTSNELQNIKNILDEPPSDDIPMILQMAHDEKVRKQQASLNGTGRGKVKRSG